MPKPINIANATRALHAALACLGVNDTESALEYIAVAVATVRYNEEVKPGELLLAQTQDSQWCAIMDFIDPNPLVRVPAFTKNTPVVALVDLTYGTQGKHSGPLTMHTIPAGTKGMVVAVDDTVTRIKFAGHTRQAYAVATRDVDHAVARRS